MCVTTQLDICSVECLKTCRIRQEYEYHPGYYAVRALHQHYFLLNSTLHATKLVAKNLILHGQGAGGSRDIPGGAAGGNKKQEEREEDLLRLEGVRGKALTRPTFIAAGECKH